MTIRRMTPEDVNTVIDWAAAEGWNPGLDDAEAFLAADPDGFFLKTVDGRPAAAVSVVNHSDDFAFLGLYICHPDFRGQGHGIAVWRAGLEHAGGRCVGLDAVTEQSANYVKSGFAPAGRTVRYCGRLQSGQAPAARACRDSDIPDLMRADRAACGYARERYMRTWFAPTGGRRSFVVDSGPAGPQFGTVRLCREGAKIGPLLANTEDAVDSLFAAFAKLAGTGPVYIDVPEAEPDLVALVTARDFEPVFETTRMYLGGGLHPALPRFYGVATLELG